MHTNGIRVLLVDDEEDAFILIRHLLSKIPGGFYKTDWAPTYEEGLALIEKDEYDVYLLDYRLGARDGLELLREALARGSTKPIIILTATSNPEADVEATKSGAADFLVKDLLDSTLLERSIRYSIEHFRTLRVLRETEARFALFMQNVPCAVFMKNVKGQYVYVNETSETIFQRKSENWLGKTDEELFDSAVAKQLREKDLQVWQNKKPLLSVDAIAQGDEVHYWLASKFPILDDRGQPLLLGGAALDITESKKAEERIRFQANVLSQVNDAVVGIDCQKIITYWNQGAGTLYGFKAEEAIGHPIHEITRQRWTKTEDEKDAEESLKQQGFWRGETIHLKRSGQEMLVESSVTALHDDAGQVVGWLSINRDITEARKAEEVIREKSQMLNGILSHLPVLISRIDEDGTVIEAVGLGLKNLGVGDNEMVGTNFFEEYPEAQQHIRSAIKGGSVHFVWHGQSDGRPWYFDNYYFFDQERGRGAVGFSIDITERKLLERQILEISEQEQSRIGQDLHDGLCQQLTGLACMSKVLQQKLAAKNISEASDAGELAKMLPQIISQTRDLARGLYPAELETNDLQSALTELTGSVEKFFQVKCELKCDPTIDLKGSKAAIHVFRIAQEAINNAIRHGKATKVRVELTADGDLITLSIRDNGCGISEQNKNGDTGGMGMRVMNYRAGVIGGSLEIRNAEGGGTVVLCSFSGESNREGK